MWTKTLGAKQNKFLEISFFKGHPFIKDFKVYGKSKFSWLIYRKWEVKDSIYYYNNSKKHINFVLCGTQLNIINYLHLLIRLISLNELVCELN